MTTHKVGQGIHGQKYWLYANDNRQTFRRDYCAVLCSDNTSTLLLRC